MITQYLQLYVTGSGMPGKVEVIQADSGRKLKCQIMDMTIPEGCTARVYGKKPSGAEIYNDCSIKGNAVIIELTTQFLAEIGTVPAQVELTKEGNTVTSFEFLLVVKRSMAKSSAIESSNEFTALEKALNDAKAAAYQAVSEYVKENGIETGATEEQIKEALGYTPADEERVSQLSNEIGDLKDDVSDLIRVEKSNNLLDKSKIEIGKWCQKSGGKAIITSNEYTNDYGAVVLDVNDFSDITISTDFTSLTIHNYYVTDSDDNVISEDTPNASCPYTITIGTGSKVYLSLKNYNYIGDKYLMVNSGESALPYEPYTETEKLFGENARDYIGNVVRTISRKCIYVYKDDNEITIADKMLLAFNTGDCDVFFEKSTYTLTDCYAYLISKGMRNTAVGLPIGNGCRYYFNGSTIISNEPTDGFNTYRNVLDSNWCGSDFEVYDCTLINNGGLYCIHDEGASSDISYTHKYVNVKMFTKNSNVGGSKPFGCGTGFDVNISFDGCSFVRDNEVDVCIAIHGATTNPNNSPSKLDLIMKNCYVNVHNIALNLFQKDRDILDFYLFGNKFKTAFSNDIVNLIENNNTTI